jgi:hypothetical protein
MTPASHGNHAIEYIEFSLWSTKGMLFLVALAFWHPAFQEKRFFLKNKINIPKNLNARMPLPGCHW